MKRITIGRYGTIPEDVPRQEGVTPLQDLYAGWIEGEREDGSTWIMWLDADGNPAVFWGQRDEDGGVLGSGIELETPTDGVLPK